MHAAPPATPTSLCLLSSTTGRTHQGRTHHPTVVQWYPPALIRSQRTVLLLVHTYGAINAWDYSPLPRCLIMAHLTLLPCALSTRSGHPGA